MSRFSKLSHVLWHCQYHIVWVPKYRYRILRDRVAFELSKSIRVHSERLGCELVELNIQSDHVHLLVKVPPKVSISVLMGAVKGKTALQIFGQFSYLKEKPYLGNHFWAKGDGVIAILENALAAQRANEPQVDGATTLTLYSDQNSFYSIDEETTALYAQANFATGIFRGNFGLRYIDTEIASTGFGAEDANGNRSLETTTGSYDFLLPRLNIVANVSENFIVRFGYGSDIRRPNFDDLATGFVRY